MKQVITMICAATDNNVIGIDNKLPYHIKADLQRFKRLTEGHCIIMGRKTFESLPGILPNRTHIVITRTPEYYDDRVGVRIVHSLEEAIQVSQELNDEKPFIIGGGEIYKMSMLIADVIELTRIHATIDGDTSFPEINANDWSCEHLDSRSYWCDRHDVGFTFSTYYKIK